MIFLFDPENAEEMMYFSGKTPGMMSLIAGQLERCYSIPVLTRSAS